jgi:hypothetical protein
MYQSELTAYATQIADGAQRRFGADRYSARHDAYTRDAALDLWLSRPGFSVAHADQVVSWARVELGRRMPDGTRR